jgi:hypothetical protein
MNFELPRYIFGKYSNIKFNENPSSGSRIVPCGQTGSERYEESERPFSPFFASAQKWFQDIIMGDGDRNVTGNGIV